MKQAEYVLNVNIGLSEDTREGNAGVRTYLGRTDGKTTVSRHVMILSRIQKEVVDDEQR